MLAVSNSIKNAYNQYTTKRKSKIKVGNNEYFIQNMSLLADAYDEGNIVGNVIAKTLEFDIETEYVKGLDEFVLYDGVWTGDKYEYINLGTFKLFEEQGADDFFSHITAYDKLILFKKEFNPNLSQFPTTIFGLLQNICNQASVVLKNNEIVNGDKVLNANLFVENETLKDILKAICEISGTFAVISEDELQLKLTGTDTLTLNKYQLSNPEYKRTTWKINQVVLAMKDIEGEYVQKSDEEDIQRNGVHKIVINNNPFTYTQELRQEYINDLFEQLRGFGYVAFETNWEGLPYIELGDSLEIDGYESLVLRYQIKSPDGLNSYLQAPSIIDSVIDYIDNTNSVENRLKRTEYRVDKENQTIEQVVSDISEQNTKISQITQTVDELNSKISDIADITISGESNFATFTLDNINESEPIQIKVKPVSENISYLYPHSNLYPSSNLYPKVRKVLFENLTTNETFEYVLPDDLLYYNNSVYDEFILDYGDGDDTKICQVIKRCQYNADGTVSATGTEQIVNYPYPTIMLTDGDYKLSLQGYEYGYLFARLMAKNIYTTQFATKVEMNSKISQTTQEINLEVSKKVGNNEIISKINQSAEQISINANKIKLEGYTTINNGFSIDNSGNATMNNAHITGGRLLLDPGETTANLKIGEAEFFEDIITLQGRDSYQKDSQGHDLLLYEATIQRPTYNGSRQGIISLTSGQKEDASLVCDKDGSHVFLRHNNNVIWLDTNSIDSNEPYLDISSNNGRTFASTNGIWSPAFINNSTEDTKKNIKDFKKNALNLIKNTDLYEYNYKGEKTKDKKHIGIVIGKNYNYPKDILSNDGKGVDLYAMVSVCFKAIQEQQEQIEELKEEINKLKGDEK